MGERLTIFIDLDGTMAIHNYSPETTPYELLPGTIEKLLEWKEKGHCLVLTTNKKLSEIGSFLKQIEKHGVEFDHKITELPTFPRMVINDRKFPDQDKAFAINLVRNHGIGDLEI